MNTSTSTIKRAPIILTFLLPIVMLAMPTIPAWAAGSDSAPISMASVRSFPKRPVPHRSFIEAVSTDVDGSWGGIETLDVPHTESPEEQATRIQAEQARQSQAASRAEPRTSAAVPSLSESKPSELRRRWRAWADLFWLVIGTLLLCGHIQYNRHIVVRRQF